MRLGSVHLVRPKVLAVFLILLAFAQAKAAEPLAGTWRLKSQNVGGQSVGFEPLTLRITPSGRGFEFAYSVPVNNIQFVSMRYLSGLDGTEADVKDPQGAKIGSIKISKASPLQYNVTMQGVNRPTVSGKLTVSADRKTLTSDSNANLPGRGETRTVQIFSR